MEINNGNNTATSTTTTMTKAVNNIVFLFIHSFIQKKKLTAKREWMVKMARGCLPMQEHKIQYKISTKIESGFFPSLFSFLCTPIFLVEAAVVEHSFALGLKQMKCACMIFDHITSNCVFFLSPLVTVLLSLEYTVVVVVVGTFDCVLIFFFKKATTLTLVYSRINL